MQAAVGQDSSRLLQGSALIYNFASYIDFNLPNISMWYVFGEYSVVMAAQDPQHKTFINDVFL